MKEKRMLIGLSKIFLILALVALPLWTSHVVESQEKEPIRIGVNLELTGIMSGTSVFVKRGYDLVLQEIGYKVAGRKIEIIEYDNKTDVKISMEVAKKLVEKDKVHILCFGTNSAAAIAVAGYAPTVNVPMVVIGLAGAERVTLPPNKYVLRLTYADGQMEGPFGGYAYDKLGARKLVLMGPDYAGSTGKLWAFRQGFVPKGGEVIQTILWPLGTMDMAPYVARIKPEADSIFYFEPGDVSILRFLSSYSEMGFKQRGVKLTSHWIISDEQLVLPVFGEKMEGIICGSFFAPSFDSPENKQLLNLYYSKYGTKEVIADHVPMGYDSMKFICNALEAIKGNIEDQEAFLQAMRKVKIKGTCSWMSIDENGNIVRDTLIRQVQKVRGKVQNVVIGVIPQVRQPPQCTTLMPR
jgi:branched-chain amino acid transport system substrate-binding protein